MNKRIISLKIFQSLRTKVLRVLNKRKVEIMVNDLPLEKMIKEQIYSKFKMKWEIIHQMIDSHKRVLGKQSYNLSKV